MSDRHHSDEHADATDAAQRPHVPGHNPLGTGMPRQRDTTEMPDDDTDDDGDVPVDGAPSPLGGSKTTEDQLTADTELEKDALKALDPDDTPD
ncbi:hypothetical protein [Microbacterium esteraromaticum]|uniref:hypothetical protein n=1 Tax=Microbacterium esteraromaticum TaxID=57043 RepID=UPI001C93F3BC|nr:hypothetical protein [Microbacterium esteraromaticum]MBY6062175.1 hypothetical protein [Microbacterium esteraromaticum]